MIKEKNNAGKSVKRHLKGPDNLYQTADTQPSSYMIRKIMTPVKRGTVSRLAIRKAVREIIAARHLPNAS